MLPSDLRVFRSLQIGDLADSYDLSLTCEPTVASSGRWLLVTGNWFASLSPDNGITWRHIDPDVIFGNANGRRFCCDQVTVYDPSRDLFFWLLQYGRNKHRNTLRLAVAHGNEMHRANWYTYDFTPDSVNPAWTRQWFDYPDLALSTNNLYITSNVYDIPDDDDGNSRWTRSVALRISLDELAGAKELNYDYVSDRSYGSLRCTRGASDVMYFGSVGNVGENIRVFRWHEGATNPTWQDVGVSAWSNTKRIGPDKRQWLVRDDDRMLAGWVAADHIGFMWDSAQHGTDRPYPYIRCVRLRDSSGGALDLVDEPDIWNKDRAWAYPSVAPNHRGHLGLTALFSGGPDHPSHAVAIDDDFTRDSAWEFFTVTNGTHSPGDNDSWGDFLSCRPHSPDGLTWICTGFTLQGGTDGTHIVPSVVHFGRRREERAVSRWSNL